MITENDRLSRALLAAEKIWPENRDDKGALLRRILETGVEAVEREHEEHTIRRRKAVKRSAGSLNDIWPPDWRNEARSEWPE